MNSDQDLIIDCVSDIHFFHKRTKSPRMLSAIRNLFPDNEDTGKANILFITGDYFDHLVSFNDPDIYYAMEGVRHFLRLCKKWDIILRVLEGTNFHDRKQNQIFSFINDGENIGADVKYVDTLSIEYIARYDLNVLYLPDEWTHNAELTYQQAYDLIHSRGLEKVDIAAVHGGCTYQLPGIHSPAFHDATRWSDLVNLAIFAGHIHGHSRYLNWISVGSLERLGHGEEEAKGALRMTYRNGREIDYERRINHHAKVYRTLPAMGMEIGEVIDLIDQQKGLEKGSAVRLEFSPEDPVNAIMDVLKATFPDYELSDIRRGKKQAVKTGNAFTQQRFEFKAITPSSIKPLLTQRWNNEKLSEEAIENSLALLDELIEER